MRNHQSRLNSLAEAVVNTFIGFFISLLSNYIILPLYGMVPSWRVSIEITIWFTFISVARGYFVRRMWETSSWKRLFSKS